MMTMTAMDLLKLTFLLIQLPTGSHANSGCGSCDMWAYCQNRTHTCCLDANVSYHLDFSKWNFQPRYDCVSTIYITDEKATYYEENTDLTFVKYAWMITRCKENWDDDTIRQLCESQKFEDNIVLFIPVSYRNVPYRNKFCAQCSGISDLSAVEPWITEIYCDAELPLLKNILSDVKRRLCNVFVSPPVESSVTPCQTVYDNTSHCSLTAKVSTSAEARNFTCSYPSPVRNDIDHFCYECESEITLVLNDPLCGEGDFGQFVNLPPFSAILDITVAQNKDSQKGENLCEELIQVYDPELGHCLDLHCDTSRYLSDGKCVLTKQNQIQSPDIYLYNIKLTPQTDGRNLTEDMLEMEIFQTNLHGFISNFTHGVKIFHLRVFRTDYKRTNESFLLIQIAIDMLPESGDILSDIFLTVHSQSVQLVSAVNFTAEMVAFNMDFDEMFDPGEYLAIDTPFSQSQIHLEHMPFQNEKLLNLSSVGSYYFNHMYKLLVCPFLKLQFDETVMEVENDFLTIKGNISTITLSKWDFELTGDNSTIIICLEDFLKLKGNAFGMPVLNVNAENVNIHPKEILAFVCICFSIACLLITLTSYFLFSTLQSQPGINNVILCACLLLAQTFYQFGSSQTSLPDWACAVVGAFCHFFWLTVMFSMNICSIEMYFVFKKLTKLPSRFELAHTLRNLMYVICFSILFVIINVVLSLIVSKGQYVGYGGTLCYLSSPVLQTVTFVIPSAAAVVANIVLFALVVLKINASSIGSANLNQERNYLGIYTRLSSIVGLTWIFGFLQLLIPSEILDYLFIILNASQGVFIMMAFIVNKRTLSLYCKVKERQKEWTESNSSHLADEK